MTPPVNPPTKPPAANTCATITVNLQNVKAVDGKVQAPVVIKNAAGKAVFTGTATSGQKLSTMFEAGTYTVAAQEMQGYQPESNTPQSVTLDCAANANGLVTLSYRTQQAQQQQQVRSIGFTTDPAVTDSMGQGLPFNPEVNANKNVRLYASQTEEPVLVQMVVRDAAGAPVAGARVNVSADSDDVTIIAGHVQMGASASPLGIRAQAVAATATAFSDANGIVRFTVYATSAPSQGTPVKFVVSASDASDAPTSSALAEFKMFFTNMSHLYYADGSGRLLPSGQRLGGNVGSFDNNWFNPSERIHSFATLAYAKQPQQGPVAVGGGQDAPFPGYVTYTLTGPSDRLFLTTNSGAISGSGSVTVGGGQNVYLRPALDVRAEELPLSTGVRADYYYQVRYGSTVYDFLLKSYNFTKTFSGAILQIEKTGPNILTWTGFQRVSPNSPAHNPYAPDDVNLPPRLDRGTSTATTEDNFTVGKTYTYTIRVRNSSTTTPARDVTVRDELPAELGYVLGSARIVNANGTPTGGTLNADYDLNTHTIDFNTVGDLAPGAELRIAIDVYPRHKPGYAWNDNDRNGDADPVTDLRGVYGLTPPETIADLNTEYEDPYDIKNRAKASASNAAEVDAYKYINIVRPVARITKTALDQEVVSNQQARFNIRVDNFDRSTLNETDSRIRNAYARLKALFPNEYPQEGFLYNARIEDTYGPAFSGPVARDENGNLITLERSDQMNGDRRVGLNLGTLLNGTSRTITMSLRGEVIGNRNQNCVRLFAWNLNQLYRGNPNEYLQFEGPDNGQLNASYELDNGRNFLEDCAYVDIVGKPAWGHDLWDHYVTAEEFDRDNGTDAYPVGSPFVYDTYYDNEGTNSATNVFINAALPRMVNLRNSSSIYLGFWSDFLSENPTANLTLHQFDLRDPSTWTATFGDTTVTLIPADDQRSFRFHVDNMEPGERIGLEFQVVASQKGDDFFNTTMTWDQGGGRTIVDNEHTYITDAMGMPDPSGK
ncbi:hypothetical protein DAERI_050120 [Deinococcus aerius]|uniref:DUF11 domain-containing protein n=1 Tax=Deinococcus aerius TaxID=200253 RepID=A0A2I9DL16_9DEIO|nr:DUF11 domain-containing protein [Deinococcus aerius]GBF05611.1 hypothetical protein DAERI_050120 [Deinococcus aerius]